MAADNSELIQELKDAYRARIKVMGAPGCSTATPTRPSKPWRQRSQSSPQPRDDPSRQSRRTGG